MMERGTMMEHIYITGHIYMQHTEVTPSPPSRRANVCFPHISKEHRAAVRAKKENPGPRVCLPGWWG
jgi:hypothetical protein